MKILVTGGAGFIGSHFIRYILHRYPHYQVINLDYLTYAGSLERLQDVSGDPRYTFIYGDVAAKHDVWKAFALKPDAVVHFAAESHVDRSIADPDLFVRTNMLGTQVLLEAVREHGIRKYIQISTDEVYGTLGETGLFTEETPLAPNSPYSASKASADLLVRSYYETYGLPVTITRCSNNYGSHQYPEKLIPLMISRALKDQPLPLYGDGFHIRDWLYVEDHCRAVDLVLHRGRDGEVYNIGGSNERTNLELVRLILEKLGKPDSLIQFVPDRPGHDRRYGIDAGKIRHELGWYPEHTLEEGLVQTIQWYIEYYEQESGS